MHLPSRTVLRRSPWLNSAVRESNVRGLDLNSILSRNKSTIRKVTQVYLVGTAMYIVDQPCRFTIFMWTGFTVTSLIVRTSLYRY